MSGKYDMEPVSDIDHWTGKKPFELFVAHCLWRLRLIGRHQSKMMEKQLAATLETNHLLRKIAGENEPDKRGTLAKIGDLLDDGKMNRSNTKKKGK